MPKRINITKGQHIRVRGRDYEFFNAVPPKNDTVGAPHDLQFRDVQDHRIEVFTEAEFDRLYNAGQVILADCVGARLPVCAHRTV